MMNGDEDDIQQYVYALHLVEDIAGVCDRVPKGSVERCWPTVQGDFGLRLFAQAIYICLNNRVRLSPQWLHT